MSRSKGFLFEPNWHLVITALGLDRREVLHRARLPSDLLVRDSVRLTPAEHFTLWALLETETGDPLHIFQLVDMLTEYSFCPPYFAALCCPNLAYAARRVARYKRLATPAALEVTVVGDELSLGFQWPSHTLPPTALVLAEFAFMTKVARMGTRATIRPRRIVVSRTPYSVEPLEAYFGAKVETGGETKLSFTLEDAMRPFSESTGAAVGMSFPERPRALSELDDSAMAQERVRAVLHEALPSGRFTMIDIARRLAMSRRTLQRRLSAEGTTFQQILTRVRETLARHYLMETPLSCTQIAFLLGFEDPNSFFRAFHDWTGSTPERLRSTPPPPASSVRGERAESQSVTVVTPVMALEAS